MRRDLFSPDDETPTADGDQLDELPEFDLDYSFDERQFPSEVTVFPEKPTASVLTSWITSDLEDAIPLEEVA